MSNARNLSNLLGTGTTIATASIADDAITSAKIADDAVVAAAIADDAVTSAAIAANAVGDSEFSGTTGKVLQVAEAIGTGGQVFNSTTFTDFSGLSVNITPSSTSSTILVIYSVHTFTGGGTSSGAWGGCGTRLLRDSTVVYSDDQAHDSGGGYGTGCSMTTASDRIMDRDTHIVRDSPSSSSQLTYKVQGNEMRDRGGQAQFNFYGAPARLVVMEVGG